MKICIWCKNGESENRFNNKAHIVPKSLGGNLICENVCDKCNLYFGSSNNRSPAIEMVIKETFGISRAIFLHSLNEIGKNNGMNHFKSTYFNLDFQKKEVSRKLKYQFISNFQEQLADKLIKGIYKMFLEANEFYFGNSIDSKFEFIRNFSRHDLGEYPVFYFRRAIGIYLLSREFSKNPDINLDQNTKAKILYNCDSFCEFEILGHVFSIPLIQDWPSEFDKYISESEKLKSLYFDKYKEVKRFDDIDFTLKILQE